MALEQDYTFQYKDTGLQLNRDLFPGQVGIVGATNLIPNPSAEATDGEVVVWQNLVTNPGVTAVAADATLVRTNLCQYPSAENGTTGWTAAGGTLSTTTYSPFVAAGTNAYLLTTNGSGTAFVYHNVYVPVAAGQWIGWEVGDRYSSGITHAKLRLIFRNDADADMGQVDSPVFALSSNAEPPPVRYRVVGQAPAGTTKMRAVLYYFNSADETTPASGSVAGFDGSHIVVASTQDEVNRDLDKGYFDGSTEDSGDYTYNWTGPANASTSEQRAGNPFGWFSGTGRDEWQVSVPWTQSGKAARAIVATTSFAYISGGGSEPAAPGDIHTIMSKAVADRAVRFKVGIQYLSETTTVVVDDSDYYSATAGEIVEMRHTSAPAPAGTTRVRYLTYVYDEVSGVSEYGTEFTVGDPLLVRGVYVGSFFSGSTPPSEGFTHAWLGSVDGSVSERRAPAVYDAFADDFVRQTYQSKMLGAVEGSSALAVRAVGGGSVDTFAPIGGGNGAGFRLGMEPGKTYTLIGTVTTPVAQQGPLAAQARCATLWYRRADGAYVRNDSPAGPVTGTAEVRVTATIPTDATEAFVRLYNGSGTAGDTVYWDRFALVEGEYDGSYFDGSFPGEHYVDQNFTKAATYYWTGEPDASTSVYAGQPELSVGNILFDVERVNGLDSADVRLTERVREGMDGGFADAEFENMRTIIIEGMAYGDPNTVLAQLDRLKANYAPGKNSNPFYLRAPGIGERVIFAKALGARYNWEQALRTGKAPFQIQLKAEDPTIYGDAITLTTGVATVSTGRGYNKSYNYGYGGVAGSGGTVNAYNNGTKAVPAIITLRNVMNPSVVHDGLSVRLNFEITLNDGDWLDIDLRNRTVRLNGSANRRGTLKGGSRWFLLEVGDNALRFLGNPSGTGAPSMTVTYRPGYR